MEQLNDLYPKTSAGNTRPIAASNSFVAQTRQYSPESINCRMISNSGAMLATSLARYLMTYLSDGIHHLAFFDPVDNSPATVAIRAPPVLAI